jgi:hypothetical protein
MSNQNIYDIISKYTSLNGIKPNTKDIIDINDDIMIMIKKFDRYYNKCFEFACGDARDMCGFDSLNKQFMNYYNDLKNEEIENDTFIKNMIYHISYKVSGCKYIYPKLILNIKFIHYDKEDNIFITISNMNNEHILDLILNKNIFCKKMYESIFNNSIIISKYNLYEIYQLELLYDIIIIERNNKTLCDFIKENNINLINIDI